MQETTAIYLLDHPSGYEWRYQLGDLLQEFYEEVNDRALRFGEAFTESDGIWVIRMPANLTAAAIDDCLRRCGEQWSELDAQCIWRPGKGIPIDMNGQQERLRATGRLVDAMYGVIVAMANQAHIGVTDADLMPEGQGTVRFSNDLLAAANDEDELERLMWTFGSMLTALRAIDPDVGVWFQPSIVFTVGGGR